MPHPKNDLGSHFRATLSERLDLDNYVELEHFANAAEVGEVEAS